MIGRRSSTPTSATVSTIRSTADVQVGGRLYNDFIFVNLMYDVTQKFVVGIEYTHWKTHYQGRAPGESDHIEFAAKYSF